ncbi:DUF5103 domain-containing protein [Fulvivirga sp. M361]|uniref:type IX secretion system plug protein n=1 Tax=Fulvivirga sp. M361 TaxID=2594266 RepID=UPI00117B41D4|nr:DUF5103 domain-containing protein [Fulvivirga sp. M361]TRX48279.1 DUF5103 domain-containing protein [Fulvivirga sp. M361]
MRLLLGITVLICLLSTTSYHPYKGKKLRYEDVSYEEEIKTVQLYPNTGNPQDKLLPPTAPINQNTLFLEFDDLVEAHEEYRVMLIHCNADWTPSRLKSLDYLYDYNEFNITTFEYSVDTKISYVHYSFRLPRVKLPGNYLLVAYRGSNSKDIILSKRFMIYQRNVGISVTSNLTGVTSADRNNQQIDFEVIFSDYEIINPSEFFSVTIRQNERWDNAIFNLKPRFIRESQGILEYRFFDRENSFPGNNEYRFFDLRSLRYPGQNVGKVDMKSYPSLAYLMVDQTREYQAYAQYEDINGDFYIQNTDTGNGQVQSDYVTVRFMLNADRFLPGDVHVIGKMNNYMSDAESKMTFNKSSNTYQTDMILKQGFYNYQYLVRADTLSSSYLEGNHYETENGYEIMAYYRPMNLGADLLVGYTQVTLNPRN